MWVELTKEQCELLGIVFEAICDDPASFEIWAGLDGDEDVLLELIGAAVDRPQSGVLLPLGEAELLIGAIAATEYLGGHTEDGTLLRQLSLALADYDAERRAAQAATANEAREGKGETR